MADSTKAWGVFPHAERRQVTGRGYVVRAMESGHAVDQYNYGGVVPLAVFGHRAKKAAEQFARSSDFPITLIGDPGHAAAQREAVRRLTRGRKNTARRNADLFDSIHIGDRVTIVNRFGQERTGRATIHNRAQGVWVLNMGGPHGTPGIATRDNVVRVTGGSKGRQGGFVFNGRRALKRAKRNARGVKIRSERAAWLTVMRIASTFAGTKYYGRASESLQKLASQMVSQLDNRGHVNPLLGIFGANPKARIVRELGKVVEVRYKRKDDGKLYFHPFTSRPRLLALSDGSIWIRG